LCKTEASRIVKRMVAVGKDLPGTKSVSFKKPNYFKF